jgi:hypothetical protein
MPSNLDRPLATRRRRYVPFWVVIAIMAAVCGTPLVLAAYVILTI